MKRWLLAAVCAVMLCAGSASANGFGQGYFSFGPNLTAKWGQGQQNGGAQPGVLGPWYLYWPYEAHFGTPAHPQFTGASCLTLPGGQGAVEHPGYNVPSYWK